MNVPTPHAPQSPHALLPFLREVAWWPVPGTGGVLVGAAGGGVDIDRPFPLVLLVFQGAGQGAVGIGGVGLDLQLAQDHLSGAMG